MAKYKPSKRAAKIVEKQYAGQSEQYKELATKYYTLAHRADARMLELEKLSKQAGFENVLKYAYRKAEKNLRGGTRFEKTLFKNGAKGEKITVSYQTLAKRIRDIETFLDSVSSTKTGIEKVYQSKADALNEKYKDYGIDLTWEDIEKAMKSGIFDKLKKMYGSETAFIVIGMVSKGDKDVFDAIKNGRVHEVVPDEVIGNKINDALADNNIDWQKLDPNFDWDKI